MKGHRGPSGRTNPAKRCPSRCEGKYGPSWRNVSLCTRRDRGQQGVHKGEVLRTPRQAGPAASKTDTGNRNSPRPAATRRRARCQARRNAPPHQKTKNTTAPVGAYTKGVTHGGRFGKKSPHRPLTTDNVNRIFPHQRMVRRTSDWVNHTGYKHILPPVAGTTQDG